MTTLGLLAHDGVVDHAVAISLAVGALAAWAGAARATPAARRPTTARTVSFAVGVVAASVAVSPPLEALAARSFSGHMVQHLCLIVVAAPLLVVSRPGTMAARLLWPAGHRRPAVRRARRSWHRRAPVVAAATFVGVLVATHLTGIYDLALRSEIVHHVEHGAYLGAALLLWSSMLGARPGSADAVGRIAAVFAVIAGTALLGMVLLSAGEPLVATYADRSGEAAALVDQRRAASIMWVAGMATTLPLLFVSFWRWAEHEERTARRREAIEARRRPGERTPVTHVDERMAGGSRG